MPESGSSVQVALRIRPLVTCEVTRGCRCCLRSVPSMSQVCVLGTDHAFTYNYVFGPDTSQAQFYAACVKQLVKRLFDGFNVTVLAYGQTCSGKTFSMGTCNTGDDREGVIPRAVKDIFHNIYALKKWRFHISVSFLELYREQLYDLLSASRCMIDIREDDKGVVVPGLTEIPVSSAEEATEQLKKGSVGRATGSTAMNAQSSRSHAIFTVNIQKQNRKNRNHSYKCKFHVVDLAGSERQSKTKSTGDRLKEGISINRGLLSLGNVISALGSECPKGHVSYRDSKLTRLLQQSLGGNSVTLLIACVSPADYNMSETLSTLRYAYRARRIRNRPVVNLDPDQAEIARLREELLELRTQLLAYEVERPLEERYGALVGRNMALLRQLNDAFNDNINLVECALLAELARERMRTRVVELQHQYAYILAGLKNTCPPALFKLLQRLQERIDDLQLEAQRSEEELHRHDLRKGQVEAGSVLAGREVMRELKRHDPTNENVKRGV